jgi:hypothetical protein
MRYWGGVELPDEDELAGLEARSMPLLRPTANATRNRCSSSAR